MAKMTKNQFEILQIWSGMTMEGLCSEAAIGLVMVMGDSSTSDIAWLIKTVGAAKKSPHYKEAERKLKAKKELDRATRF